MEVDQNQLMDKVWEYPLFQALSKRRARRFALGTELRQEPYPFKSDRAPVPLSELETAALCWAGYGATGLITGELEYSQDTFMSWTGRTVPSPCNDQHNELILVNDDGAFLYRPKPATLPIEIETVEDRRKILTSFREGRVEMINGRPDLPPSGVQKLNQWDFNKPGQAIFFPLIDITWEYINALFVWLCEERYQVIDDLRGNGRAAGLQKWFDSGHLNGPKLALSFCDTMILAMTDGIGFEMAQNISLAATALGLGTFTWGGYIPLVLLGGTPLATGLGFRFQTDKAGMPMPVGKDGFIQPSIPPYVANMDAAVDQVVEYKFGKGGLFSSDFEGAKAFKDPRLVCGVKRPSDEDVRIVKAFANYIYDTYGRFPALVDPIQMPVAVTAHHLDLDFYDQYYKPGVISPEQREHMRVWHGQEE